MEDHSGNWPILAKIAIKWAAKKVVKPIVKKFQNTLTKCSFTYSTGISGGVSGGGYGVQAQGGISFDSQGNIAIQATIGDGISTATGYSGTTYRTVTNAPDISNLEGPGYQAGGMYGWNIGYVPVVAGIDGNYAPKNKDGAGPYHGGTLTTGVGTSGLELHANGTYTWTWGKSKVNIFEIADKAYDAIMAW